MCACSYEYVYAIFTVCVLVIAATSSLLRCSKAVRHTIAQLYGTRSAACTLGFLPHGSIWKHFESLRQGSFSDILKLEIDSRCLQVAFVVIRTLKTYLGTNSIQDLAEFCACVHSCCRACNELSVMLWHPPYMIQLVTPVQWYLNEPKTASNRQCQQFRLFFQSSPLVTAAALRTCGPVPVSQTINVYIC